MTTFNKATLKTFFEQGDIPTGTNYADLIDSCLNLVETGNQSMAGPLTTTELITPRVSSANMIFAGGTFAVNTNTATIGTTTNVMVSAGTSMELAAGSSITVSAAAGNFIANVGNNINLNCIGGGTVNLNALNSVNLNSSLADVNISAGGNINMLGPVLYGVAIVSAAGTAQATAAVLSAVVNRGKGIVDGSTTGFRPRSNKAGMVQYLFNEGASANLWPPVGGFINGLAVNTPFSLAASAMVTIVHLTASAMAVK